MIKYSEDGSTWKTFGDVINQTKPVLKTVVDFSEEEINARYVIVEATVNEKKWVRFSEMSISTLNCPEEPDKADKTALIERVEEITNELRQLSKDKTKETIDALIEKLNEAKEVIKDKEATEERVAEILAQLNEAYDNLEDKEAIPEIDNPFGDTKARIVSVDAGRKYFSVEQLKQIIDKISEANYTHLHLLVGNDGMRLLLNDMEITTSTGNYGSEEVKAGITKGNQVYSSSKGVSQNGSKSLTEDEMNELFDYAAAKDIKIIPSINSPGHMDAILVAMEELGIQNPYAYNGSRKSVTTLNIEREDVKEFTKEFVQLYIDYFASKGVEIFNFGADEYANDAFQNPGWSHLVSTGKYDLFVEYANDLSERILRAGMRPMAFNDGFYYGSKTDAPFNKQVIIALWTAGWSGFNVAPSTLFIQKGHDVLNVNDSWYYVMGRETSADGWYHRQMALEGIRNKAFDVNVGDKIDTIGSMVAMWADQPRKEFDLDKFVEWINAFAERNSEQFAKKVDKDKLISYVEKVEEVLPTIKDSLKPESLERINTKLQEAKAIIDKADATQEEVDMIYEDLEDAFKNAEFIEEPEKVDKKELETTLDLMKELIKDVKDLFTEDSISALEAQFEASEKVIKDEEATQQKVDESLAALNKAYKDLVAKEPEEVTPELNTETLEQLIENIEAKLEEIQDKVKPESLESLKAQLEEAKEVLEKEELTQEEVDEQLIKLIDEFTNIEFKEVEVEKEIVDTTVLENLIRVGELKLREDLTEESAQKLDEEIRKASQLLNKEDLTNEELTEQIMSLLDVILSVEHEEPEQPEPEQPDPEQPDPEQPDPEQPEEPKLHDVKGFITGTTNVRVEPNGPIIGTLETGALVNGQIIGSLSKAQYVEGTVTINNPNWIRIKYNNTDAYIYRSLIDNTVSVKSVVTDTVNVRQTPNGKILGTLKKGVSVNGKVSTKYPNWVEIQYKGQTAYIYKMYVK